MADMIEITWSKDALNNLDKFFDSLGSEEQKRMTMSAMRRGTKPMIATARNLAPFRKGMLYNSIGVENAPNKKTALLFGMKSGGIYVGWRGRFIDRGYTTHGPAKRSKRLKAEKRGQSVGRWISGQNFMKDAYMWQEDNYFNIVEREIQQSVTRKMMQFSKK